MQSDNSVVFKAYLDDDVRRFTIDKSAVTNYEYLKAKLQNVFPNIGRNTFSIKWVDDDGDKVTISSDDDLVVALSSIQDIVKKLYISVNNKNNNQSSSANRDDDDDDEVLIDIRTDINMKDLLNKPPHLWANFLKNSPHPGVVCDSCQGPVVGFRYKCIVCDDFDLCGNCEGNFSHPHHIFMRFPWPMGRNAHRASRKAGRMFRSLKKDRPFGDDNVGCPRKFRRDDSADHSEERKCQFNESKHGRHHGHHGPHHGGHHGGRHGPHHDGPHGGKFRNGGGRETWYQTFHKFVNEFTNLAGGDPFAPTETNNNNNFASASSSASAQAASSPAASAPLNPETAIPMPAPASAPGVNQNGNSSEIPIPLADINAKIVENIGATITNILKPFGMEFNMELKQANIPKETNVQPNNNNNNNGEPTPSTSKNQIVNDLIDAASESEKRNESPERNEDWTILNSEEHVEEATEKTPLVNKSVGFDMEKISKDFHRHVGFTFAPDGSASQSAVPVSAPAVNLIYPSVPQQENSFFSAEMLNQPIPVEPEYRPSIPHIANALDKMLSMGFKNDGGRLARLLESKNGNISEVLDILTKNIP